MNEYKPILGRLLVRLLIAVPFFVAGKWIAGMGSFASAASPFLLLAGALIVAAPLARLLAEPLGNLLFPGKRFDRPQPIYGIPLARKHEGHYEEALDGFRKIACDYPDEVQAWIEMVDVAITGLHDGERAQQIFEEGMATLKGTEQRQHLAKMYVAIKSRLQPDRPPP